MNILHVDGFGLTILELTAYTQKHHPYIRWLEALSYDEAVEHLKAGSIDAVISDVTYEHIYRQRSASTANGADLLGHTTVHYPDIPFYLLTAERAQDVAALLSQAGQSLPPTRIFYKTVPLHTIVERMLCERAMPTLPPALSHGPTPEENILGL